MQGLIQTLVKVFLITFVIALAAAGAITIAQTVHWRIKLNTGEVGQIIAGSNDTDPALLTAVQSTARIGVNTVSPVAKLDVFDTSGAYALTVSDGTIGFGVRNIAAGARLGTYTNHTFGLRTNNATSLLVATPDSSLTPPAGGMIGGRIGIGVNPSSVTNVNARLTVCRTGNLDTGTQCTISANVATVVTLGSSDDAITGQSLRQRGMLVSEGDLNVITSGKGFVVKESNGANCRRITVNAAGTISASAGFACP